MEIFLSYCERGYDGQTSKLQNDTQGDEEDTQKLFRDYEDIEEKKHEVSYCGLSKGNAVRNPRLKLVLSGHTITCYVGGTISVSHER